MKTYDELKLTQNPSDREDCDYTSSYESHLCIDFFQISVELLINLKNVGKAPL